MDRRLTEFERIVRSAFHVTLPLGETQRFDHPFDTRNIHPLLPSIVRKLFDDSHYSQATFEAFKYVDQEVSRLTSQTETGLKLMMHVFSETTPLLRLTPCNTLTEKDEQKGFQFLFAGSILAIRNPRGHMYAVSDTPDECLDHLALASVLLRRLESAGFKLLKT